MTSRSLLMLAFEFPPLGTVGSQRPLRLAAHLPLHGVTPVIVTTDADSLTRWFDRRLDEQPLRALAPGTVIHRIACPKGGVPASLWARRARRWFSIGDEDIGRRWRSPVLAQWDRIVSETRPAAIYVSIPPFSVAPLALELARRSGLKLVLDFRDGWSQWCQSPHQSWLHYQLVLRAERRCLEGAHAIVATTAQINRELQAVHPGVPAAKFHVVPNGYDSPLPVEPAVRSTGGPFVIGYVGSFYYLAGVSAITPWRSRPPRHWLHYSPRQQDWLYRTPYFFFRALARLLASRPGLRPRVRVRFAGDREPWLAAQVAEFGLQDVVEHVGRISLAESLAFQSQCDALLSTSAKAIGGRDQFIAGKTFEYVASGRPVVAFVAEGEQKDFWEQSGIALICDPDDPDASATGLERLITGAFAPRLNRAFLAQFDRKETARQLAALIPEP
jgi:glycosyltransferase involved in cell wall biosynthesis